MRLAFIFSLVALVPLVSAAPSQIPPAKRNPATTSVPTTSTRTSSTSTTLAVTSTRTTSSSPTSVRSTSTSPTSSRTTLSSSTSPTSTPTTRTSTTSTTSLRTSSSQTTSSASSSSSSSSKISSSTARTSSSPTPSSSKTSSTSASQSTSRGISTSSSSSTSKSSTSTSTTASSTASPTYALTDNYVGSNFLSSFSFETFTDPTHGRVNYVNQSYALSEGLVSSTSSTFTMKADSKKTLSASGPGRDSIRIKSNKQYTTHLAVFDVAHMPQGCGTWPALWENDDTNWPNSGEVDIIEGVNDVSPNAMTLHTTANCAMPATRNQTGTTTSTDCYWETNGNQGCGVEAKTSNSYGPSFNAAGGGWYVLERTSSGISVWFWSRQDSSVPSVVKSSTNTISSSSFGIPIASFPSTSSCNIPSHFGADNIIIDLTFCGDWAGNSDVYSQSGCPGTCVDYVNNNPSAFSNAYWTMNAIRVYT